MTRDDLIDTWVMASPKNTPLNNAVFDFKQQKWMIVYEYGYNSTKNKGSIWKLFSNKAENLYQQRGWLQHKHQWGIAGVALKG